MIIVYNSVTHVSEHLLPFSPVYTMGGGEGEGDAYALIRVYTVAYAFSFTLSLPSPIKREDSS